MHQEGAERGLTFSLLAQGDVAAFFVADLGAVVRKHFCFLKCLPRVRPFYTVKCNSSPGVLKVLAELGLGFSCARGAESTFLFPFPIGHSTLGRERGGSTLPPKLALLPHRAAVRPLGS